MAHFLERMYIFGHHRTANSPKDGWEQLFDELFKDPVTRQIVLPWSTDILWESDLVEE